MHIILFRRKWLILAAFLILLAVVVFSFCAVTASSETRDLPVYEVASEEQKIAVSFDASWGAEHTEDILAVLNQYDAGATFFLVDLWITEYPELTKEIADAGFEIGLHSETHAHFPTLSDGEVKGELTHNAEMIRTTAGVEPALFRFPYGDYDDRTVALVKELGFTPVQWSIDSLDWKDLSAAEITERVTRNAAAGDIVLFHNNGLHTAEALPAVLEAYKELGLTVVSVSDLLLKEDHYTDINGVQRRL